jgi:hypothetical protein
MCGKVGECFLQFLTESVERWYFDEKFVVLEQVGELGETKVEHVFNI